MECGRSIGTVKWQKQPRFNRIVRDTANCPKVYAAFTRVAGIATTGFMNTGCIEDLAQKTERAQRN